MEQDSWVSFKVSWLSLDDSFYSPIKKICSYYFQCIVFCKTRHGASATDISMISWVHGNMAGVTPLLLTLFSDDEATRGLVVFD